MAKGGQTNLVLLFQGILSNVTDCGKRIRDNAIQKYVPNWWYYSPMKERSIFHFMRGFSVDGFDERFEIFSNCLD